MSVFTTPINSISNGSEKRGQHTHQSNHDVSCESHRENTAKRDLKAEKIHFPFSGTIRFMHAGGNTRGNQNE